MKVMNPDYQELQEVPIDIELRSEVGISLDTDKLTMLNETVDTLFESDRFSKESMAQLREKYIYNVGTSGKVGAKFIIDYLINKEKK